MHAAGVFCTYATAYCWLLKQPCDTATTTIQICCSCRSAVMQNQSTVLGRMHSPQHNAALQNWLTAALYKCNTSYAFLLLMCSHPTARYCISFSVQRACCAVQRCSARLDDSSLVPLLLISCLVAFHTAVVPSKSKLLNPS